LTTTIGEAAMDDPLAVLGLEPGCDDATIRRRYLELVRQYSPEHHPERFAAIRAAYEKLRDLDTRLRYRLFEAGKRENIDALVEEVTCRSPRRRVSLEELLAALRKP
jgi:curved DNA-binding protein CbpA